MKIHTAQLFKIVTLCLSTSIFLGCNSTSSSIPTTTKAETVVQNLNCDELYKNEQYQEALLTCKKELEQGNKDTAINIGNIYVFGYAGDVDVTTGVNYYLHANSIQGLYKAARVYEKGINTNVNKAKALHYYQIAADKNDIMSCNYVGNSYYKGRAVGKDLNKAFYYFKKAADLGDSQSQYQTALFYEQGVGTIPNAKEAYRYMSLAADKKYQNAMMKKAIYEEDGYGTVPNYDQAIESYKLIIEKFEDPTAYYRLGKLLVDKNISPDEGITYIKKSVAKNYIPAYYYLGYALNYGMGIEQSCKSANEYLNYAAQNGSGAAMLELGNNYYNGCGFIKNMANAYAWYKLAENCKIRGASAKAEDALSQATLNNETKSANQKFEDYSSIYKCKTFVFE